MSGSIRVIAAGLVLVLATVSSPRPAYGQTLGLDKLDAALVSILERPVSSLERVRVIVSAKPGQLAGLLLTLRLGGYKILAEHPAIEAVTLDVSRLAVTVLSALNLVQSISIDAPTRALGAEADTPAGRLLGTLGLAGSPFTGAGVGVAVIDSGLAPVAAFGSRISAFYDFTSTGKAVAKPASDDYGHGTHVAGLIGGSGAASAGVYAGIAPDTRLVGLKVLDGRGAGYTSHVISAIEFATKNAAALGIHVINLSLGHPIYERAKTDPLVRAVEHASARGLVVVASAGNYGTSSVTGEIAYGGITSPGNAPSAITVGALDTRDTVGLSDDSVTSYSSCGPTSFDGLSKPDLVAPGHALSAAATSTSWLWNSYPSLRAPASDSGQYLRLSGTSMAAGVVAGVVALVIEANRTAVPGDQPRLTPNAIKAVLQFSALPSDDVADRLAWGAGRVNAHGATELARRIDTTAARGSGWLSQGVTLFTSVGGQTVGWAQHLVWGHHIVWGDSTVWDADRTWGSHIVWGDSTFTEQTAAWGNLSTSRAQPAGVLQSASQQP